jgi:methyl-accepting chemotaxis protein
MRSIPANSASADFPESGLRLVGKFVTFDCQCMCVHIFYCISILFYHTSFLHLRMSALFPFNREISRAYRRIAAACAIILVCSIVLVASTARKSIVLQGGMIASQFLVCTWFVWMWRERERTHDTVRSNLLEQQQQRETLISTYESRLQEQQHHRHAQEVLVAEDYTSLKQKINAVTRVIDGMKNKNFSVMLDVEEEDMLCILTFTLNEFFGSITTTVLYLQTITAHVANAADTLLQSSQEVSASSHQQFAQAEQAFSAIEQVTGTFYDLAERVRESATIAAETVVTAQEGRTAMTQMLAQMDTVMDTVVRTTDVVQGLGESSGRIGVVVETIEEIADQTNLLALNAAIEAARAGDAGRGFAVVADEVRKLAERTRQSTKEIVQTVQQVRGETASAVQAVERSKQQIQSVTEVSRHTQEVLERIVSKIQHLGDTIQQISDGAARQNTTVDSIHGYLTTISHNIQESADNIENIATSTKELTVEVRNLQNIVQEFDLGARVERTHTKMRSLAENFAANCTAIMENAVQRSLISEQDLFDRTYTPIPNTKPQKYTTCFDNFTDRYVQQIEEACLGAGEFIVFAILVDNHGYCPTHNLKFSQPLTGDPAKDLAVNRTKRIFDDPIGLKAGRNQEPFLLQTYRRDTGEFINDISVPVYVHGRHWGGVRIGFRTDAFDYV